MLVRPHYPRLWLWLVACTMALALAAPPATGQGIGTQWSGAYHYPDGSSSVPFQMQLQVSGSSFSGRTSEPATFGDGSSSQLYGTVSGDFSGSGISFVKTYDGTGGVDHSVYYDGSLSADGRSMSGSWETGGWSGRFEAYAADAPVADETCGLCGRALVADVEFGLGSSAMLGTYVGQSLGKYANCTRKADGGCGSSCWQTTLAALLPNCDRYGDAGHRACVEQTVVGARTACE